MTLHPRRVSLALLLTGLCWGQIHAQATGGLEVQVLGTAGPLPGTRPQVRTRDPERGA